MPRKPPTPEEIAIKKQVEDFIKTIKMNAVPTIDLARAQSYFERAQKYQNMGLALLRGEEVEEVEPGKNKVGRPKKGAVSETDGELFRAGGELFRADSAAAGEHTAASASKSSKSKKYSPVGAENYAAGS